MIDGYFIYVFIAFGFAFFSIIFVLLSHKNRLEKANKIARIANGFGHDANIFECSMNEYQHTT